MRIAFGCQARVGKDLAAEYMQQQHGGTILRFAGPLKDIQAYAQKVCGFDQVKDPKFLQMVGTEWARAQDEDVWVKALQRQITDEGNYFISDLRFLNEATMLQKMGFILVRIAREDRVIDRDPTHVSENELVEWDGWDIVINNNSTIDTFKECLDSIVD